MTIEEMIRLRAQRLVREQNIGWVQAWNQAVRDLDFESPQKEMAQEKAHVARWN